MVKTKKKLSSALDGLRSLVRQPSATVEPFDIQETLDSSQFCLSMVSTIVHFLVLLTEIQFCFLWTDRSTWIARWSTLFGVRSRTASTCSWRCTWIDSNVSRVVQSNNMLSCRFEIRRFEYRSSFETWYRFGCHIHAVYDKWRCVNYGMQRQYYSSMECSKKNSTNCASFSDAKWDVSVCVRHCFYDTLESPPYISRSRHAGYMSEPIAVMSSLSASTHLHCPNM